MLRTIFTAAGLMIAMSQVHANAIVKPDSAKTVRLSNTDINRVVCQSGEINDVFFSQEKGVTVVNKGGNAFVKYLVKQTAEGNEYITQATEIHVICDSKTYTLIGQPSQINAQTVYLNSGQNSHAQSNIDRYKGMAFEERILDLTQQIYRGQIDDHLSVSYDDKIVQVFPKEFQRLNFFNKFTVKSVLKVQVDGLNLQGVEYHIHAKQAVNLQEQDFMEQDLGIEILGITLSQFKLKAGEVARLIIIQREPVT